MGEARPAIEPALALLELGSIAAGIEAATRWPSGPRSR